MVERSEFSRVVESIGVDVAISPRRMTASAVLRFIRAGSVVNAAVLDKSAGEVLEFEVKGGCPVCGQTLAQVDFPEGAIVGALVRGDKVQIRRWPHGTGRGRCRRRLHSSQSRSRRGKAVRPSFRTMNLRFVSYLMAVVIVVVGVGIFVSAGVSAIYGDSDLVALLISGAICLGIGLPLYYLTREAKRAYIGFREGFLGVSGSWIVAMFFGSIPFILTGVFGPLDAFFETMSGFTTTGASVLTDYEQGHGIMFWRSLTHWYGGMGIVVLFIAAAPAVGEGGHPSLRGGGSRPQHRAAHASSARYRQEPLVHLRRSHCARGACPHGRWTGALQRRDAFLRDHGHRRVLNGSGFHCRVRQLVGGAGDSGIHVPGRWQLRFVLRPACEAALGHLARPRVPGLRWHSSRSRSFSSRRAS